MIDPQMFMQNLQQKFDEAQRFSQDTRDRSLTEAQALVKAVESLSTQLHDDMQEIRGLLKQLVDHAVMQDQGNVVRMKRRDYAG